MEEYGIIIYLLRVGNNQMREVDGKQRIYLEWPIPQEWKSAFVTPIFKKEKDDPSNYRPVSLTSIVCKTLEHILVSQIMKHLETNSILCNNQYGFRARRSCESQLLLTIDNFAHGLNNRLHFIIIIIVVVY